MDVVMSSTFAGCFVSSPLIKIHFRTASYAGDCQEILTVIAQLCRDWLHEESLRPMASFLDCT